MAKFKSRYIYSISKPHEPDLSAFGASALGFQQAKWENFEWVLWCKNLKKLIFLRQSPSFSWSEDKFCWCNLSFKLNKFAVYITNFEHDQVRNHGSLKLIHTYDLEIKSTQVHFHGPQIVIHDNLPDTLPTQVYYHRPWKLIHTYELEIESTQVHFHGPQIVIYDNLLDNPRTQVHNHRSQKWIYTYELEIESPLV